LKEREVNENNQVIFENRIGRKKELEDLGSDLKIEIGEEIKSGL
jgi:hypothetical protein